MMDRRAGLGWIALALLVLAGCSGEDPQIPQAEGPADDPLWDLSHPPTYRLHVEDADWQGLLTDLLPADYLDDDCFERTYAPAQLVFMNPVDGAEETYEDVGVRWRGQSSLEDLDAADARVGIKLSFNEFVQGRRFHDTRKINLLGTEGDHSAMHEWLALQVMREQDVPAPRSTFAMLYVNDEFQGLYPQSEEPDDEPYLENHFGDDKGSLYKVSGYCGGRGRFEWDGDDPADYVETYVPKAGTLDEAMTADLLPMLQCANSDSDEDFEGCIGDWIDVHEFMREMAVDAVMPDGDGLAGNGQNFMLYFVPQDQRFAVYPWDKDQAFVLDDLATDGIFDFHPDWWSGESVLVDRLRSVYRTAYCEAVLDAADRVDPDDLVPLVEQTRSFLEPYLEADPFVDVESWSWAVADMIDTIESRHPQVVEEAESCAD
jgi:spore coat protein CotH